MSNGRIRTDWVETVSQDGMHLMETRVACTGCDAAETLPPILAHGQAEAHTPGD
ncbi:hypothetical protein [Streptomyces sp. NPDC001389]|uniref:hypothetical protein n=1 Tax=Streptomyces sp. NPDC001389 TaxID=3364569 RepID=UPI00367B7E36